MKILFLGDSITEGAAASSIEKTYVSLVGNKLGCEVKNFGKSGTRIAKQKKPSDDLQYDFDFLLRAKEMDETADYVFVFGGTNDYGHGDADFGDLESQSSFTFCGAVKNLLNYLIGKYGKEKICVIPPLFRYREDDTHGEFGSQEKERPSLKEYVLAIKNIAKSLGLNVLDLRKVLPPPKSFERGELYADGLHPTDKGHEIISEEICNYIRSQRR